jgi:dihydrofolate synthase / folylpolyglutamate synthase
MASHHSSRKHAKRTPRIANSDPKPRVADARKSNSGKTFPDFDSAMAAMKERLNVEQLRPAQVDAAKVFNLDRMTALMAALGNPQRSYKTIHVAGSKGKGSVCEMTASALQACGYTVGLYTSPHLVDISERIRINQRPIPREDLTNHLGRAFAAAADLPRKLGEATYFELLTAAAFLHFAEEAVDIAVIEVGMGGRVDATNIVLPEVAAIAAIQLEHTQILGDTLEKIAREKAGIFKAGIPAVSVPQKPEVLAVLRECATAAGTKVEVLNEKLDFSYRFEASVELGPHARVCLSTARSNFEHLPVPLKGEHQAYNCGLTLAILDRLRERGMATPEGAVANGLAKTPSNGRLELVHTQPRIMIDGAHNPESISALVKAIGAQVRYDSMVVVFGCAADKDAGGMLTNIALGADKIIFTRAEGSLRAMDPKDLVRKFAEVSGRMAQQYPTLKEALNKAAQAVQRDDLILVTGSFAVAGEAKRLLLEKARKAEALTAPAAKGRDSEIRELKELGAPLDQIFHVKPPISFPKPTAKEMDGGPDDKDKHKGKDAH